MTTQSVFRARWLRFSRSALLYTEEWIPEQTQVLLERKMDGEAMPNIV